MGQMKKLYESIKIAGFEKESPTIFTVLSVFKRDMAMCYFCLHTHGIMVNIADLEYFVKLARKN